MSGETGSSTNTVTIYIPLLNEGTVVHRPTQGVMIGKGVYKVLPTANYALSGEEWEFPPESIVECVAETREGREVLIARRKVAVTRR
jgi:hypothetical protein